MPTSKMNLLHKSLVHLLEELNSYVGHKTFEPIEKDTHQVWLAVVKVEDQYEKIAGLRMKPSGGVRLWRKLLVLSRWQNYSDEQWASFNKAWKIGQKKRSYHPRAIKKATKELMDWTEKMMGQNKAAENA